MLRVAYILVHSEVGKPCSAVWVAAQWTLILLCYVSEHESGSFGVKTILRADESLKLCCAPQFTATILITTSCSTRPFELKCGILFFHDNIGGSPHVRH